MVSAALGGGAVFGGGVVPGGAVPATTMTSAYGSQNAGLGRMADSDWMELLASGHAASLATV